MTFEEKLQRLSEISSLLESKNTGLDEGLKAYEEASILIDECIAMLNEKQGKFEVVKKRIEELTK